MVLQYLCVRDRTTTTRVERECNVHTRQQHRRHKRNTASVFYVSLSFFLEKTCLSRSDRERQTEEEEKLVFYNRKSVTKFASVMRVYVSKFF